MREYAKKPQSQSRTLDSNPKASRQAPIADVLEAYKNATLGRQPVQRESMEDEELLQAKTSGQAQASVILQQCKESMQQYTSKENKKGLLQDKFEFASAIEQKTIPDRMLNDTNSYKGLEEKVGLQEFEVEGDKHEIWILIEDEKIIPMVASDPITIPEQLRLWRKKADKIKTWEKEKLKDNVYGWINHSWDMLRRLNATSAIIDPSKRKSEVSNVSGTLKVIMRNLFWWDKIDFPSFWGAVAFYRGIHFSKDWEQKRGRTIEKECSRNLDGFRKESSYSSATWEIAKKEASLQDANMIVLRTLSGWRETTDANRTKEISTTRDRKVLIKRLEGLAVRTPEQDQLLEIAKDRLKQYTGPYNWTFANKYLSELSHYIHEQSKFEEELRKDKNTPFNNTPFISTTKEPLEAIKYAQGKLANSENRSTEGNVGRVLIYVAPYDKVLEAGGIDVWEKYKEGELRFTEWRMNENEITFSGNIPETFLAAQKLIKGDRWFEGSPANLVLTELKEQKENCIGLHELPMDLKYREALECTISKLETEIRAKEEEKRQERSYKVEIANEIEIEASKEAAKYGGLKPLKKNE